MIERRLPWAEEAAQRARGAGERLRRSVARWRGPAAARDRWRSGAALLALVIAVPLILLLWRDDGGARRDLVVSRAHLASAEGRTAAANRLGAALTRQIAAERAQAGRLQAQVADQREAVRRLEAGPGNPAFESWNACGGPCALPEGTIAVYAVPGVFQVQLALKATAPIRVYVLTLDQFAQFAGCRASTSCVVGAYRAFGPATSIDEVVNACTASVLVVQADTSTTLSPDVKERYLPEPQAGACGGNR
jgi:hypothetical protein